MNAIEMNSPLTTAKLTYLSMIEDKGAYVAFLAKNANTACYRNAIVRMAMRFCNDSAIAENVVGLLRSLHTPVKHIRYAKPAQVFI